MGIIPTSVGSTDTTIVLDVEGKDHPHERGEHFEQDCREIYRAGIIPTSVGSTRQRYWERPVCRDHPHERGEHMLLLCCMRS